MSVGFPTSKDVIDGKAGRLALSLRDTFRNVNDFKTFLDGVTDATLQAAPLSYTAGEVTTLRGAITDLYNLGRVANGLQAQASPSDFFFAAKKLTGVE